MGNCALKGYHGVAAGRSMIVRVATCNGGVMELFPPVTADCITNGFPGHAIYRTCDALELLLMHSLELVGGEIYYLRPINSPLTTTVIPQSSVNVAAPYRVSFDQQGLWRKQDNNNSLEVGPLSYGSSSGSGLWKVKLVISPAQLAEILSQESTTVALIESVRTVAKCGNGSRGSATSVASSDQWSLASSRKAASETMGSNNYSTSASYVPNNYN